MPEMMLPDGTWKEVTWDGIRERSGEDAVRALTEPSIPESEMTSGQRYLADKMQEEALTSAALAAAGIESLDDLRVEGDDEPGEALPFDHPVPEAYDFEQALEHIEANHPEMLHPLEPDADGA